jgi:plasmid stability protein
MADILVRDLEPHTVERLKNRARQHGRSLQSEVKIILEEAGTFSMEEARKVAEQWRQRLAGRVHSDSAELIREDRDHR